MYELLWKRNTLFAILALGLLWMGNHMLRHHKDLVVHAAAKADVLTVTQWAREEAVAVKEAVTTVGKDLGNKVYQLIDDWHYGPLDNYDFTAPPGLQISPDELRDWVDNRKTKSDNWLLCQIKTQLNFEEMTTISGRKTGDPAFSTFTKQLPGFLEPGHAEAKSHLCDYHLLREPCGKRGWRNQQPTCSKPTRDLPRSVRQKEMTLYAVQYMKHWQEIIYVKYPVYKYYTKQECKSRVDKLVVMEQKMHRFFDVLLASVDLKMDRSVWPFKVVPNRTRHVEGSSSRKEHPDYMTSTYALCDSKATFREVDNIRGQT